MSGPASHSASAPPTLADDAGDAGARSREPAIGEIGQVGHSGTLSAELPSGSSLGRYLLIDRLGAGAMGVVYAAFDPELDRRLALKVLHPRKRGEVASARLLREAKSLARLSHPNVVAVHDVGRDGDQVFVAMEYVDGHTAREWAEKRRASGRPATWKEVVDLYIDAGRGLASAHDAGLVHRDLKPENLMIARDGRVRVMDFGLARPDEITAPVPAAPSDDVEEEGEGEGRGAGTDVSDVGATEATGVSRSRAQGDGLSLTRTGALVGTPAYMAPEVHAGLAGEPASDQFSFFVSLYETTYGRRPFDGETVAELTLNVGEGRVRPPPREVSAPPALFEIIRRGLAKVPQDRFESMHAAVAELAALRRPRGRRRVLAVGVSLGLVAGGAALVTSERDTTPACPTARQAIAAVWSPEKFESLRTSMASVDVPYAEQVAVFAEDGMKEWTSGWGVARAEACAATRIRHEASGPLMDRKMACLDTQRVEAEAVVSVFERADETVLENAARMLSSLPDPRVCLDTERLLADVEAPRDAATAASVDEERTALAGVTALRTAGKYAEALAASERIEATARTLGYAPLLVSVLYERGHALRLLSRYDESEVAYTEGYYLAIEHRDTERALTIASDLVLLIGYTINEPKRSEPWIRHARALLQRAGRPWREEASLSMREGLVATARGQHAKAIELMTATLEVAERELGPDALVTARYRGDAAVVLRRAGEHERSLALHRQSIEVIDRVLGSDHPHALLRRANYANALLVTGRLDEAQAELEHVLERVEARYGDSHEDTAQTLSSLANVLDEKGEHERALTMYGRAREGYQGVFGPDHESVALMSNNLGATRANMGDYDAARADYERALAIYERVPADPADVALVEMNLGEDALRRENWGDAQRLFEQSMERVAGSLGADHPVNGTLLAGRGRARAGQGERAAAIEDLRAALVVFEGAEELPSLVAPAKFALASVLEEGADPAEHDEAMALARDALASLASERGAAAQTAIEIREWLARRGG